MGVGARRQRHRGVRGLADQRVPEAKSALTGDERERGSRARAGQQLERSVQAGPPGVGDERFEPADVERLALDGAGLDHPALRRAERVEAGGQQRVQRRWERAGLAALGTWAASCSRNSGLPRARATTRPSAAAGTGGPAPSSRRLACSSTGGGRRTSPRAQPAAR